MAISDTFRRLITILQNLEDRILDLESEHGEIAGWHFGNSFPTDAYPNQIVVRTDQSPPDGGVMYRYDKTSGIWRRLN